ncbi:MAG: alpha/beta hydrolase [Alphaproteobacteria bacterium]|nr:alpha/beta hydrolase [Alphaproteobacteria bacterium]
MSHAELQNLVRILTAQPAVPFEVAAMRQAFDKFALFAPAPADAFCQPVSAGGVAAEFVAAPAADTSRTLLYLHGGGYAIGSIATHRLLAYNLSKASGARCLVLDYRLAPEHPFPAALDDAVAAYRWLLGQGQSAKRIAIAGDSAGGGLGVASLVRLRDEGVPLPAMGLCLSPWTDLAGTGDSIRRLADADPLVKPGTIAWMAGL